MGAGRRTQSSQLNDVPVSSPNQAASYGSFRDLRKSHLGGVIFGCKNSTIKECLSKQLFGLPAAHFSFVKNIDPGLPLFLFNYSDRKLHGIFEAASPGKMNIDPYGWTADGKERTSYPAQVQVRMRLQCQALREDQFKPIIMDNYYSVNHFWFELDHAQTNNLISLLSSLAVAPTMSVPQYTSKWRTMYRSVPSPQKAEANQGSDLSVLSVDSSHSFKSNGNLDRPDIVASSNRNNQLSEPYLDKKAVNEDEKNLIYMKLKELALTREPLDSSSNGNVEDTAGTNEANLEKEGVPEKQTISEVTLESPYIASVIAQLVQEMEELLAFKTNQSQKMKRLEKKLVKAETEIHLLKERCMNLESGSDLSVQHVDVTMIESSNELQVDLDEVILLVGGYDGMQWLSALDVYSPTTDTLTSRRSMYSPRSYFSIAKLNGELYAFGGGNGSLWYDTVESYNPANNQWTMRPSLNRGKGSLAGATLNNKIFALGGGNGLESFSDVEMLDLDVGRWISTRSMSEQRFALGAAELNGAIYAFGGYNGNDYLKSAERFDPREHSWIKIEDMNSKRGCHSVVVMNEKLYVMGGFDGASMVQSMEIFDPRAGSWMTGPPMKHRRGYAAAAVLKESIYIIGGVLNGNDIVETVEYYKEGDGWKQTQFEAVDSRCFASAIVFGKD